MNTRVSTPNALQIILGFIFNVVTSVVSNFTNGPRDDNKRDEDDW